jgi:phenylpropionate dioxygenase-like ring-hydroxylating dioxygenase large terminal subunit
MSSIDTKTYLSSGGYLQKAPTFNLRADDLGESVQDLLPARWFRDEKIYQLERRAIFSRYWHVASFVSKFQKAGDYLSLELFGWPFFLIRDKDSNINAFHNVCRHRGHPVINKEEGCAQILTCRFHGWTYQPTGALHKAPQYMALEGFQSEDHGLFKVHTHITSHGFIFVNFDASPTPSVSFADQFGDDFDAKPQVTGEKAVGDDFNLFPDPSAWEYDHTWHSSEVDTKFNWKTFADGFQECYHCATGHPTTLPKDFCLNDYYLRQGHGASRHFLPPSNPDIGEAYITWLYPIGAIIFSENLLFIARFSAEGALDTSYQSETYRRKSMPKPSQEYDEFMEKEIGYWRFVEVEDVDLAVKAQRGFMNGVLGKGRLHPVQEHAVKWYQDKVRKTLVEHAEMEQKEGRPVDYSIPAEQRQFEEEDALCKMMGPEVDW